MQLFLRNKLYRAITLARMINLFGSYIYNIVFITYAATMKSAPTYIFIANMITIVPMFLTFWVGVKADQTKLKGKWLICTGFIQAIIFTIIAGIIQNKTFLVFSIICLGNIISDILSDYLAGLRMPILQKNLDTQDLFEAYSFSQFTVYICSIGGQAFGIWLLTVSHENYALVAYINALTFFLSSLIYLKFRNLLTHDIPDTVEKRNNLWRNLIETWETLQTVFKKTESTSFLRITLAILFVNLLGGSLTPIYNFYLLKQSFWNLSYGQGLLLIEGVSLIGAILGSLWTRDGLANRTLKELIALDCLFCIGLGMSHLIIVSQLLPLVCIFGISYLTGKISPKLDSLLMAEIPSDLLARSDSLISLLFSLAIPLGTILFSSLASQNLFWNWIVFTLIAMIALVTPFINLGFRDKSSET